MRRRLLLLALLSLGLVGCDHATKEFAFSQLRHAPVRLLSGALTLTYTENRDMAFGLLGPLFDAETRLWILSIAKSLAIVGGAAYLVARHARASLNELVAVSFIIAGAGGNLLDRVTRGFVVDFLRVPHWPVFNVADVAVSVGYGLLFLGVLRERVRHRALARRSTASRGRPGG